jgi:hypothetical protein
MATENGVARNADGRNSSGLTDAQKLAAVNRWHAGENAKLLAKEHGVHVDTIRYWSAKLGRAKGRTKAERAAASARENKKREPAQSPPGQEIVILRRENKILRAILNVAEEEGFVAPSWRTGF